MIKEIVSSLNLTMNENLFMHVKLKGISGELDYTEMSKGLLEEIVSQYAPKTVLIPTYTYSYAKTGIYDRVNTPSEVGRFSEEIRRMFDAEYRTMNPIFSFIDVNKRYLEYPELSNQSAFEEYSHFDYLSKEGFVIVNINMPRLYGAHLHYIERHNNVDYRFHKYFPGKLIDENGNEEEIVFDYHVRRSDIDTIWKANKIEKYMLSKNALTVNTKANIKVSWYHSKVFERIISDELRKDQRFLINE